MVHSEVKPQKKMGSFRNKNLAFLSWLDVNEKLAIDQLLQVAADFLGHLVQRW